MYKLGLLFIFVIILSGCNIFSWSQPDNIDKADYSQLYDQYVIAIHNGNFDSAIVIASKMISEDKNRSDGYVLKAKAYRYKYFNKYFLLQELLKTQNQDYFLSSDTYIPFWDINVFTLDSIYQGNRQIKDLLSKVYFGNMGGDYTKDDISLDYIISNTVYALISIKDLNNNGTIIDDTAYFKMFSILMTDSGLTLENLSSLYDMIKDDPSVFNATLDRVDTLLNLSNDLIGSYANLDSSNTEKIDSVVAVVSENLDKYKIADGVDNDGDGEDNDNDPTTPAIADGIDNDGDGLIDEGIDEETIDGIDNDGDGLIDEDANALPANTLDSLGGLDSLLK